MDEDNIEQIVENYIDLVAIGTIADVMPLKEENRAFVRRGIQKLNTNPRKSLAPLIGRNSNALTSQDIAFQICPRINAMGRIGDAKERLIFFFAITHRRLFLLAIALMKKMRTDKNRAGNN